MTFLFLLAMSILFPSFTKYGIITPILGFMLGGFFWCMSVVFFGCFADGVSFLSFILGGMIVVGLLLSTAE